MTFIESGPALEPVQMLENLLTNPNLALLSVNASPSGIRLDLGEVEQVALVCSVAKASGWLVTLTKKTVVSIEPRYTPVRHVPPGTKLYHVSDACKRARIAADGLKTGIGGNTTLAREYPPRLHLCHKLGPILAFVNFQVRSQLSIQLGPDGKPVSSGSSRAPRTLSDLDIYVMPARPEMKFFQDSHFEGGIWTEEAFNRDEVEIMPRSDWENTYKTLYPDPPVGKDKFAHFMI